VRFDAATFGAASYLWQFGDGSTKQTTQPLAFHRFATAGTFQVTLTVTDGNGTQAQSTIPVGVAPLPSSSGLPTLAPPSARSRKDPGYSRAAGKLAGGARTVFCWSKADWAVLAPAFDGSGFGGYVDPAKPKQIGLAPTTCSRLDVLEYKHSAAATAGLAEAVLVLADGVEVTQGYKNAAQAACYGLQMVPDTSTLLGADEAESGRLGKLAAHWFTRKNLPPGFWSAQCRDGGKLDLDPAARHWP
jgi:PKD repeat protein